MDLGGDERDRHQPVGREADLQRDRAVDGDRRLDDRLQRPAPDRQHGVGGQQRVAQRAGLLGVGLLGLVARRGVAEIEVARHAQELVGADRAARAARPVGDVGLDRAEVGAAVEDDGQGLGEREAAHPHRDGRGGLGVDERAPQQIVGVVANRSLLVLHRSSLRAGRSGYAR